MMRKIYIRAKDKWIEAKPWILENGKWRAATELEVHLMLLERETLMKKFLGSAEDDV